MSGSDYQKLRFPRELLPRISELECKTLLANSYKLIILEGCWKKRFYTSTIPSEIVELIYYLKLKYIELGAYVRCDYSLITECIHEILALQDVIIQKAIKLCYENI